MNWAMMVSLQSVAPRTNIFIVTWLTAVKSPFMFSSMKTPISNNDRLPVLFIFHRRKQSSSYGCCKPGILFTHRNIFMNKNSKRNQKNKEIKQADVWWLTDCNSHPAPKTKKNSSLSKESLILKSSFEIYSPLI